MKIIVLILVFFIFGFAFAEHQVIDSPALDIFQSFYLYLNGVNQQEKGSRKKVSEDCKLSTDVCESKGMAIMCPMNFEPVCGCDGITYANKCEAMNHGCVTSVVPGPC